MLVRSLAVLWLASMPFTGRAEGALPVALYPVEAVGLDDSERADVQSLLQSALLTGERRGNLRLRTPAVLAASCPAPASDGCLAKLSSGGVVLVARAKERNGTIFVTVAFVDATGRRTRAIGFTFDPFLQDLRPAVQAVAMAEAELPSRSAPEIEPQERSGPPTVAARDDVAAAAPAGSSAPAPSTPSSSPLGPTAAETAPPAPAPSAPAAATARPAPNLRPPEPTALSRSLAPPGAKKQKEGAWKGKVGPWASLGGVALLAGGATAGLLGTNLAEDLKKKFQARELGPGDAASYDRLDLYEVLANSLLVAGGVVTATGLTLWAMAPDDGPKRRAPGIGVMGRF